MTGAGRVEHAVGGLTAAQRARADDVLRIEGVDALWAGTTVTVPAEDSTRVAVVLDAVRRDAAIPPAARPPAPATAPPLGPGAGAPLGYPAGPGYGPPAPPGPWGPAYQPPPGPVPPPASGPPNNANAVVSLILGIFSLLSCPPVAIAGLILGYKAKREIRERGEGGDGLATAGLITSWIGAVFTVGMIVAAVVWFGLVATVVTTTPSSGFRTTTTTGGFTTTTERVPTTTAPDEPLIEPADCAAVESALGRLVGEGALEPGEAVDLGRQLTDGLPPLLDDDAGILVADAEAAAPGVDRLPLQDRPLTVRQAAAELQQAVEASC